MGAPSPPTIPHGGGGDDDDGDGGKTFVHVYPDENQAWANGAKLRAKLANVGSRGMLIVHADRSGRGDFSFSGPLKIGRSVSIVAASGDEGYINLNFPIDEGCFSVGGPFKAKRKSAVSPGRIPGADETPKENENELADAPTPPTPPSVVPSELSEDDTDMCRIPSDEKHADLPTPEGTVALCGLRINREKAGDGEYLGKGESGRLPACISAYSSKLYLSNTKVEAGKGPGLSLLNAQARMGTARPGGIDRVVAFRGLSNVEGSGSYGIRVDRKSHLLLQWTQIQGFDAGVQADGSIDLKRGVQVLFNNVGVMIGGGEEDADIFGPRKIKIGVDQNVTADPAGVHDEPNPRHWQPEIFDNEVGIRVSENFEGRVNILAAYIESKFKSKMQTGMEILPSKFRSIVAIENATIEGQFAGIVTAQPISLDGDIGIHRNKYGVVFLEPYGDRRDDLAPYFMEGVDFSANETDMNFQGRIDTELQLCNANWPKLEWQWDRSARKRVQLGGITLEASQSASFYKCRVRNLSALMRALSKSGKDLFKDVCPKVEKGCP
ncbi:MAG: hypothetical protein U1E87_03240 [Alphaproteobacteria bacterium]